MIILDTNVLSEFMRALPAPSVMEWAKQQVTSDLYITAITQAEIYYGLELLNPGNRQTDLRVLVDQVFNHDFLGRILPFDSSASKEYATIVAVRRRKGKPISQADALIAAIVKAKGAVLVTRNTKDFSDCEIILINPWDR